MTFLLLKRPNILKRFQDFQRTLASSRDSAAPSEDAQMDARANREFILEMLERNTEAFQSEIDILNMSGLYRCRR